MYTFIGIESLAANALIEIMQNTNEADASLCEVSASFIGNMAIPAMQGPIPSGLVFVLVAAGEGRVA